MSLKVSYQFLLVALILVATSTGCKKKEAFNCAECRPKNMPDIEIERSGPIEQTSFFTNAKWALLSGYIFTPNGDNHNDSFAITYPKFHLDTVLPDMMPYVNSNITTVVEISKNGAIIHSNSFTGSIIKHPVFKYYEYVWSYYDNEFWKGDNASEGVYTISQMTTFADGSFFRAKLYACLYKGNSIGDNGPCFEDFRFWEGFYWDPASPSSVSYDFGLGADPVCN